MSNTPNLQLPYIDQNQSQKHVTHNLAIRELDALTHLAVNTDALTAPPTSPADGDRYIVGAGATGAWATKDLNIAAWQDGAWQFYAPKQGWRCWIDSSASIKVWTGAAWVPLISILQNMSLLGIGTTADATNPLSAKLNGALFTAKSTGEGGTGDLRFTLNKSASGNTVSQLYQDNWSGRAETGLCGDDHFHIKVSADGVTWSEALNVDPATGKCSAPSGRTHAVSGKDIADFVPVSAPGSIYRIDRQHDQNPRAMTIASVSADVITLTTPDADLIFQNVYMLGYSYVRIWNVTTSPAAPAWVKASADTSHLQVTAATDIAGWSAGDAIQIGDPISITPTRAVAIDISPAMQALMGAIFPQKAVLVKMLLTGIGAKMQLDLSPSGVSGTFGNAFTASDGSQNGVQLVVPTNVLSPISNSNLLFLRETIATPGAIGVVLVGLMGMYV